jgi:SNF2 family DNA or RNA helicase
MTLPDLSKLLPGERTRLALRIQQAKDFDLPILKHWNYDPCSRHTSVEYSCRDCGMLPKAHQRVGAAWLYTRGHALLADGTGVGKTLSIALSLAMLKEHGNLGKSVVVCRAPAVKQWAKELNRMMPLVRTVAAEGNARKRLDLMLSDWEIYVIGRETFNRDNEAFDQLDITALVIDDVDSLRHRKNKIAVNLKRVARHAKYVYIANATPLQKKLVELHSTLEAIGGRELFGSETRFLNTYTVQQRIQLPVRGGRIMTTKKITGYQNLADFKQKLSPMALRRTPADLDDVDMPAIVPSTVWLELYPAQRAKYKEIQDGILKIIKSGKLSEMKTIEAVTIWMKAAATCTGLAALGEDDGPGTSSKLDWTLDKLQGDLADEKTLLFIHNLSMIRAAQARLDSAGIPYVTISGMDSNANRRNESVQRFWDDPSCKVLLGTQSLESSLNLQVARHLICLDLILNPARMTQLAGRISRQGSRFNTVYVHTLLNRDTQEEHYMQKLELESALIDHVWNSESELFEQLSPEVLMQMIVS